MAVSLASNPYALSQSAAQVKRVLECIQGDPDFRLLLALRDFKGAERFIRSRGVELDIKEFSCFCDKGQLTLPDEESVKRSPLLSEWQSCYQSIRAQANQAVDAMEKSLQPKELRAWRARQMVWLKDMVGRGNPLSVAIAYELSDGCSIGCSFCAFSGSKLSRVFEYSNSNARLWEEVIAVSMKVLGRAYFSCCYHATEPADNPDYPDFIRQFYEITGNVPQTTTAAPLRRMKWTERILEIRELYPVFFDRFSIHSPKELAKVHQAFSPLDLAKIPLVMLGKESLTQPVNSGRARHTATNEESIECTCGFVVNMCRQTIRLVVPCGASDAHPNGYALLAQEYFSSSKDFGEKLKSLIENHIPINLPERLIFREHLSYTMLAEGFTLNGRSRQYRLSGSLMYKDAGSIMAQGDCTPTGYMERMKEAGHDPIQSLALLNTLFSNGVIQETPFSMANT